MTETKTLDPEGSAVYPVQPSLSTETAGGLSELLRLNQGLDPEPLNFQSTGPSNEPPAS